MSGPDAASGAPAYIEFGVQSNFSLLHGASRPEELVVTACALGHAGMGLADRNTVSGVVRAWSQTKAIRMSCPITPVAGWSSPTARRTCWPTRRTARAGGICAAS
jgi:error-prone DNA polymerase